MLKFNREKVMCHANMGKLTFSVGDDHLSYYKYEGLDKSATYSLPSLRSKDSISGTLDSLSDELGSIITTAAPAAA